MRKIILILAFAACIAAAAALESRRDTNFDSWRAYCDTYGYRYDTTDEDAITYFLDVWRGSVEEEAALAAMK